MPSSPLCLSISTLLWQLGDGIEVVARTQLHGVQRKGKTQRLLAIHSVHEWDPKGMGNKTGWAKTVDNKKGGIFLHEMKNNTFKIAKWAAQCILSGADVLKIGFVSRKTPRTNASHVILGAMDFPPTEVVNNLELKPTNMFGILKVRTTEETHWNG